MIIYKKGDVFEGPNEIIIHGCNCFCAMGAGIARQVREKFPKAYQADQDTLWGDKTKLGTFTYGVEPWTGPRQFRNNRIIVNAYTQYKYTRTEVDVDYDAVRSSLNAICEYFGWHTYAMPKIGCGLAGGDWNVVEKILEEVSEKWDCDFHVYELD